LVSNQVRECDAKWILLADGKRSLTKKKPQATGDLGIKAHFAGISGPRDAIELFGVNGHYGGIAPIEDGSRNIAFSVPQRRVREFGGDIDTLFADVVRENAALTNRLSGAKRCSNWLASPLPRFAISRSWPRNIIPLGNAACSIEPIGGEGMGLAVRSAEVAASALTSSNPNIPALRSSFERLWRSRRLGCRAAAIVASSPAGLNRAARLVPKSVAQMALQLVGK
jgi:2-polyprenyl-6-methoxyphenol hydroxylase-like FAD-dependent oxidoreductase